MHTLLRPLLLADDDPDDREMVRKALKGHLAADFYTVCDGEELMDFLKHRGDYAAADRSPTPGLILLDLNMPKKDGREALAEIKADPTLRWIPVVVMTTSKEEEDILTTYALGANSFIRKPNSMAKLVHVMTVLSEYWFETVSLPN
jgi:CheY-like chemotaxis protein